MFSKVLSQMESTPLRWKVLSFRSITFLILLILAVISPFTRKLFYLLLFWQKVCINIYIYIFFLYSIYGIGWKIPMPLKIPIFTDTNPYFYLEAARIITYYITQKILGGLRKMFEKKNIFWQKKQHKKHCFLYHCKYHMSTDFI